MRVLLLIVTWGFVLGSALACQREPVRPPKAADASGHKDPEPAMPPPVPAMTVDATPTMAVEMAPEPPPPDPIETMTIPAEPVAKARLFFEMGYGAAALQVLAALPPETLEKPEVQLLAGRAAELAGRARDAVAACQKSAAGTTEAGPKSQALACQARAHWQLKEHALALRQFEAAVAADPEALPHRLALMRALVELKARDTLEKRVAEALAKWPKQPSVLLFQGLAHELAGEREKASAVYEQLTGSDAIPAWVEAEAFDRWGLLWVKADPKRSKELLARCRARVPGAGCPRTELAHSPPDPRHPERRIRNVSRPGRYGDTPLPAP